MRFRQMLPDGIDRFGYAAADGQMGQIIKAYLDWKLSGDTEWLRGHWPQDQARPRVRLDSRRLGCRSRRRHGRRPAQHLRRRVLRSQSAVRHLLSGRVARRRGDGARAGRYRRRRGVSRACSRTAARGSTRTCSTANTTSRRFAAFRKIRSRPATVGDMGADRPENAGISVGRRLPGRSIDRAISGGSRRPGPAGRPGQHPQDAGVHLQIQLPRQSVRPRFGAAHLRAERRGRDPGLRLRQGRAAENSVPVLSPKPGPASSIWSRRSLFTPACCARDWKPSRTSRRRFDGERRNPWDEPECGHHYARAMSAWSSVVAFSGFHYHAADKALTLAPKSNAPAFTSFWSTGAGWGLFSVAPENKRSRTKITVTEGSSAP